MTRGREANLLHRGLQLFASVVAAICPTLVLGQATPRELFLVCGSQPNEPTVYFSGVLRGPATAFEGFRAGFTTFLSQQYGYKGAVGCTPANTAVNAQNFLTTRSAAFRNQKKGVVDTGWTETAVAVAPVALPTPAMKPAPTRPAPAPTAAASAASRSQSAAAGGGDSSPLTSILGSVFGTAGAGSGAKAASGAKGGGATDASRGTSDAAALGGSGSTGDQSASAQVSSTLAQVSNTLASVFANKSDGTSTAESPPKSQPAASSDGRLGSAQAQSTELVVYGCGRQDMQVACVTELTNHSQDNTLVHSAEIWKDAFVVDDRGDRHPRTGGFFLNVDGDQRAQLDISYGKEARFILMFDGVPTKVQRVALRSVTGALDVEEIALLPPSADAQKR
jgi:hypothetical protein